ncbi:glycosyltransferase family 61 protein [Microbacteriaceae bacterium VKM Ac-2854]|nr:glycosyltransferase family 61 protein [Microbacteriaceae bacterium VKM Ac-2854]
MTTRIDERAHTLSTVVHLQRIALQQNSGGERGTIDVRGRATLVPPPASTDDASSARHTGGVADALGRFLPHADHYSSITPWVHSSGRWRGRAKTRLPAASLLYGGVAREHFGHFIVESLSRLWALYHSDVDSDTPTDRRFDLIAFLRSPIAGPSPHGMELLSLFAGVPPTVIVDVPMAATNVHIPIQASAAESGLIGPASAMRALRANLLPHCAPSTSRSIYVSRSRFDPGATVYSGSIAEERALEERLIEAGYEIFHPQEHRVVTQIETYRQAGRIIVNESTAMHLVALAAPASARVAVIGRRATLGPLVDLHLEAAFGESERTRFIENGARYELGTTGETWVAPQWTELCDELSTRGLLPHGTVWNPTAARLDEVERRSAILGGASIVRLS